MHFACFCKRSRRINKQASGSSLQILSSVLQIQEDEGIFTSCNDTILGVNLIFGDNDKLSIQGAGKSRSTISMYFDDNIPVVEILTHVIRVVLMIVIAIIQFFNHARIPFGNTCGTTLVSIRFKRFPCRHKGIGNFVGSGIATRSFIPNIITSLLHRFRTFKWLSSSRPLRRVS